MVRLRPLLLVAPLLAALAACANFGTSSEPTPIPAPPTSATTPPGPPPGPPPEVDGGGDTSADAEPDTARPPPPDAEPPDAEPPDAEPPDAEPPDATPTVAKKLVFVTADAYPGTFALTDATEPTVQADARCTASASASALTGTWVAYLSSSTVGALSRLPAATEWYLPPTRGLPGLRVFASRAAILAGPENPINLTAAGVALAASEVNLVWTGTLATGVHDPLADCGGWRTLAAMGRVGSTASSTVPAWSSGGTADCGKTARLYCFQL